MDYEFDPAKDAKNVAERGLSLALAPYVFDGLAHVTSDDRKDYGEPRQVAYGLIEGRLFVCVFTDRGKVRRIISLRKANSREIEAYAPKDHA
ncbi:MAG: BrnT family toxin [Alphaproteobacteria bacterium]